MAYRDQVMADSPLGYWRMETANAYDEVTAKNWTKAGTPTIVPGRHGTSWSIAQNVAIDLNAGTPYQEFQSDNTYTIEAWFKRAVTSAPSYPTIWRRDGNGKTTLIRVRGSNFASNESPGRLEVYLSNGTTSVSIYTTNRYDDGQWHHVALVVNGTGSTGAKLYVDGALTNTFNNPGNMLYGTAGIQGHAIGSGNADPTLGEGWEGGLDEVAIYGTALSATRIAAHYNEPVNASVSVLAPAMAVSLTSPAPVVTAVNSLLQTLTPVADIGHNAGTTSPVPFNLVGIALKFNVTIPNGYRIGTASLTLTPSSTVTIDYTSHNATSAWSEESTSDDIPSKSATRDSGAIVISNGKYILDVTEALRNDTGNGIVVAPTGNVTGLTVNMREATIVDNRPKLTVQLEEIPAVHAGGIAPVMTLSLSSPQHRVGTGVKSIVIGSAALNLSAPAPVVGSNKNITVQAPHTTFNMQFTGGQSRNPDQYIKAGFAEMWMFSPNPVQYISVNVANTAPAMEVTLSGTSDNKIDLRTSKRNFVTSAIALKLNMVGIYSREADRYLTIVPQTVDGDDIWYQMEETSGTVANDAATGIVGGFDYSAGQNGTYVGSPIFGAEGPKLRKAVHFDGVDDHLVLPTYASGIFDHTVEFSIKTTQQNGTIYRGGAPMATPTTGTRPAVDARGGLSILNGELVIIVDWTDPANPLVYRTGKRIADGEWHHIVVSSPNPGPAAGMFAFGFSKSPQSFVMVDGTVEWARYLDYSGATNPPLPYKVMGRFNSTGPVDAVNGEMRDFIVRTNYAVSQNTATKLYYEWSETTLVSAEPMVLNLSAVNPFSARGNKKRMIVLYGLPYSIYDGQPTTRDGWGNYISVFANYFIETNNGDVTGATGELYDYAGYGLADRNNPRMVFFNVRPFELEGFLCYPVALATTPGSTGAKSAPGMENGNARDLLTGQFVDNKTGLPRFINLQEDLLEDVTAFDAITAVNYPAVQAEENNVSADSLREFKQHNLGLNSGEWTAARDKLRDSILEAAYDGVNLWINEPHMAQHLGFIQGWDKHETGARIEFGFASLDPISATGYSNWAAGFLDLANRNNDNLDQSERDLIWIPGKTVRDPSISLNLGNGIWAAGRGGQFNWTWQANSKRLVVNLEPGLTDVPSWFKSEQIAWEDDDNFRAHARWTAYNLENRMANGLQLGDEIMLPMREQNSYTGNYPAFDGGSVGIPRQWIVSARPEGIVGKVISKEMNTYWGPSGTVRTNPWRDNVYTIAAEAGSVVRGRPIAGRAFIEFMDTELLTTHLAEDRVKDMWNGEVGRDMSRWSLDTRRYKQVVLTRVFASSMSRTLPSGVKIKRYYEFEERNVEYQDADTILRPYYSMNARGLHWLRQAKPLAAGEVRQHTNAMTLNLSAPEKVKTTQGRNLVIPVTAAEISLELRQPKNYRGNDVRERTSPMRLTMVMGGLGKTVKAPPMTLTITAGTTPRVTGGGDRIYVYMDADRNVTLYMKEE